MRLVRRMRSVEERARRARAAGGVAMVWTSAEHVLSEEERGCAAGVALDIVRAGQLGGTEVWRTVERVARDAADLGDVFDLGGEIVGHVTAVEDGGHLVTWAAGPRG